MSEPLDEFSPVFAIAIAAELAGMHPQTLRQYDRLGLVSPRRTAGQSRRYSMRDVAQLREIASLISQGLNLEGIKSKVQGRIVLAGASVPAPVNLTPPAKRRDEAQVKALFDPKGLMNPGTIVRPTKMDDRSLFRITPGSAPRKLATARSCFST